MHTPKSFTLTPLVVLMLAAMIFLAVGCSGGGSPVVPVDEGKPAAADISSATMPDGRVLWGAWKLGIDPVAMTVEVLPNREMQGHYNVTQFLIPPTCYDCISAQFKGVVTTDVYSIDVFLKNPTVITGYDVRGTVFNTGVIELMDPDGYTFYLAQPGDLTPNPFMAYKTTIANRAFPSGYYHLENFHIYNMFHPDYSSIDYVVDASWPGNCKEPYEIENIHATGVFYDDGSNMASIMCDVHDWQDDVQEVLVDLTPLGGSATAAMTNTDGDTWAINDISWQMGGSTPGKYSLLITARTEGTQLKREMYHYVDVIIVDAASQGLFKVELANQPLTGESAPTTCLDLAVVGDNEGSSLTMVLGSDGIYHLWDTTYVPQGGYLGADPPRDNIRHFDTASVATPGDIFTWAWVEVNDDPDPFVPGGIEPQNKPISWWVWIYWWTDLGAPKITGWIFYVDPDGELPHETYTESFDACGGFNQDGLQYWGNKYVDGDDTLFPYIRVHGFIYPYNNDGGVSYVFLGDAPEGTGDGKVDTDAVNSMDIDDFEGLSEVYAVFAEGGSENAVEVYNYDFNQAIIDSDFNMTSYLTIHPEHPPIDVEIIPMKKLAEDSNWIAVLTSADEVEVYKISDGSLVTKFGDSETISSEARFLDVDDLNYKVHVMQDGPQVSVFYYEI